MTLDELRERLAEVERKTETAVRLAPVGAGATSALGRLRRVLGLEIALNVFALLLLGGFAAGHRAPRFALPAAILGAAAAALVAVGVRQLAGLAGVDLAAPIAEAQRRLERLRVERIAAVKWTLILAPLLWTPLAIVLLAAIGVDAWVAPGPAWLAANLAVGLAAIPLLLVAARRLGRSTSPFVRRLADDLAGRSLARARAFLATLGSIDEDRA
jgi:hypothetical protein